jgi:hypothetical protein
VNIAWYDLVACRKEFTNREAAPVPATAVEAAASFAANSSVLMRKTNHGPRQVLNPKGGASCRNRVSHHTCAETSLPSPNVPSKAFGGRNRQNWPNAGGLFRFRLESTYGLGSQLTFASLIDTTVETVSL